MRVLCEVISDERAVRDAGKGFGHHVTDVRSALCGWQEYLIDILDVLAQRFRLRSDELVVRVLRLLFESLRLVDGVLKALRFECPSDRLGLLSTCVRRIDIGTL